MIDYLLSGGLFAVTLILVFSEKIHRTSIALAGAVVMIGVGLARGFYSQDQALEAIDFNTLGLLMGMMILVSMLGRTGFFEYLATLVAKRSRGNPWHLLVILGTTTTILSMFLDNVTTIVLIAPVTVLIAEILGISPLPFLLGEALLSNTGGVATLIGDPPNILIGSAAGFTFNDFIVRLSPIVLVAWLVALILLRFSFRDHMKERPQSIEALLNLDEHEVLRDREAVRRILIVLAGTIVLFFLHNRLHLEPTFVALMGAAAALVWVQPDVEEVLKDVDWGVLIFFAAMFVAVGGIEHAGLLALVSEEIVSLANQDLRLTGVILIWAAAVLSALVDNIPFTIAMIPIIKSLGNIGIDVEPLWWALALGAGFGGNGTPIGSTANIVAVAISEKTHTPITTRIWLRSGLPVMIAACIVGTILYFLTFPLMSGG